MPPPYFGHDWLVNNGLANSGTIVQQQMDDCLAKFDIGGRSDTATRLYHYTNLAGLKGILTPNKDKAGENIIWASNFNYLNDWTEPSYQKTLIKEIFKSDSCNPLLHRGNVPTDYEFLEKFKNHPIWDYPTSNRYIACFCGARDTLSQWRGYGGTGSGYCISFEAEASLIDTGSIVKGDNSVILRKIIYNTQRQAEIVLEIMRGFVEIWYKLAGLRRLRSEPHPSLGEDDRCRIVNSLLDQFLSCMVDTMKRTLCFFKHPSFEEEQEARLITFGDERKIDFYERNGLLVPYHSISLNLSRGTHTGTYRVSEIQFGPGLDTDLTTASLVMWIKKLDFLNVNIKQSQVPFRANLSSRSTS